MSEPKTLTPEQILELKELAAAATPGPWKVGSWRDNVFSVTDENGWLPICRVQRNDHEATDDNPDVNDAAFIASSREAVPALIEMVEKLLERCEGYKGQVKAGSDEIERLLEAASLIETMGTEGMVTALKELEQWCIVERGKLGAIDGYDYRSGEEYGLRRAEVEVHRRICAMLAAAPSAISSSPLPPAGRDWPEDFTHENGNYECRCIECGQSFIGHKRRIVCKACVAKHDALASPPVPVGEPDLLNNKPPLQDEVERIILRRLHERRIDGYTLEMARQIADLYAAPVSPIPHPLRSFPYSSQW